MELIHILSRVINEDITTKRILLEYPESTIKKLVDKFIEQTEDTEEEIRKTIADFERFKGGLAKEEKDEVKRLNDELKNVDKSSEEYNNLQTRIRDLNKTIQDMVDIFKYNYSDLKTLTDTKKTTQKSKKDLESIVQEYITKNKGADLQLVKLNIKKFFELKTHLKNVKEFKKEVTSFTPSELHALVNKYFSNFDNEGLNPFVVAMFEKFQKENPDDDPLTVILPRVKRFIIHFELIPLNTKLSAFMSFHDFEHIVDAYTPIEDSYYSLPEIDTSDIDIPYEDKDVIIYAPDQKQKCINIRKKHAPDRRWCTSWEGSSNYYYNYRLNQNLTLYYIINKKLPSSDLNYGSVILVDRYGGMRLADGSNSGRYSGTAVIPWSEILSKIPVLKGKEHYLKANPFSDSDQEKMHRYKNYNLRTTNPIQELGGEEEVELWLELRSPDFRHMTSGDEIFGNLTSEMQRKYIGLGNELTPAMIEVLKKSVLTYYVNKTKEKILQKSLSELTENDIATLSSDEWKNNPKLKEDLRDLRVKYIKELKTSFDPGFIQLVYPNDPAAKFAILFGIDYFFDIIPIDTEFLQIENRSKSEHILKLPSTIGKLTNLQTFVCDNIIKELPEEIGNCTKLAFLNLTNNKQLTTLPASIVKLTCLDFVSVMGSNIDVKNLPKEILKYMDVSDDFWEINFPPEMRKNCGT